MAIRSEEITSVIQKQLEGFESKLELSEVGYVLQTGDGIARVFGLKSALAGELLEFPNETWAAQDMRKTDVFLWAARHSNDGERMLFFERARGFFNYSVETLLATPKHQLTRPMILALANGFRYGWFQRHHAQLPVAPPSIVSDWGPPVAFVPQKARALERAKWIGAAGVASVIAIVTAFLMNR